MKFLVDAQLPKRLVLEIRALGSDARHTLDLPAGNKTSDEQIIKLALEDDLAVVTKDSDFVDSLMLRGKPKKLLFITTGNIPNDELIALLRANWMQIEAMLSQGCFVELSRTSVTLHI